MKGYELSNTMYLTLSFIFLLGSIILTKIFCTLAYNTLLIDKPKDRSMHTKPTVRGGGLVFIGLSLLALPYLCYVRQISLSSQYVLIMSIVLLASVSFLDDLYSLSARSRFLVHGLVAFLMALFLQPKILDFGFFLLTPPYVILPLVFFMTLWAINHFNFMDGLDGFCALQALFLCAAYALLFHLHHAFLYQDFCLVLILSLLGFLLFNFPPARLFMGDIGSASLGLITFSMALIGQKTYQIPIAYWFILNALFLFDATITLLRRIWNKESWCAAHKKHAYQRLKQYGVDTRLILLGQMGINLFFLMGILMVINNKLDFILLCFNAFSFLAIIYCLIERIFPMHSTKL